MSVPQGERGETKLAVIDVAENLAVYTIQCVTNENHFPKRYRWCFTKEISDKAIEVDYLLHGANGVYPTTISDRKKRTRKPIPGIWTIRLRYSQRKNKPNSTSKVYC